MLEFRKNVFDLLRDVQRAIGTDPHPLFVLVFRTTDQTYSAISFKKVEDLADYAFENNVISVCTIEPKELMEVLNYEKPHYFCQILHEWVTLHRPKAKDLGIVSFIPTDEWIKWEELQNPPDSSVDEPGAREEEPDVATSTDGSSE